MLEGWKEAKGTDEHKFEHLFFPYASVCIYMYTYF